MRVPPIVPENLKAEQRPLYDDMLEGIEANFKGFTAFAKDGAMLGPFNPWGHWPKWGGPIWNSPSRFRFLPGFRGPSARSRFSSPGASRSAYEIYAHVIIAENRGLADDKISTIVVGRDRPI